MTIDTTKESICINQLVEQKSENKIVEGDMIVPDIKPDILNIIRSNGTICVYKKEVLDGKVKVDGAIQVHIIYSADDEIGSCHSLNTNLDFSEIIQMPNANSDMNLTLKTCMNNIETKILNGRKINIKCSANFLLKIYSNENIDIIKQTEGIGDMQELCSNIEINSLIGQGCTRAFAKETVSIDPNDNLAEVLDTELSVTNKDIKVSYNKVLVKADVCIKILYVTEENTINSCTTTIPAMGFIDIQDVSEDHICDIDFELKNLLVKPNGEEEHSVYVEAEFEICCFAFERKNIAIIEDLYSPTMDLSFTQKNIKLIGNKSKIADICMIKEKVPAPELMNNKICDITVKPVISLNNILESQANYDGEVHVNVLYSNESNIFLNSKDFVIPVQFSTNIDGLSKTAQIDTGIDVKRKDFVITPDGNLDSRIDLEFAMNAADIKDVSVIDEITTDENSKKEDCSVVIYFAKPGDTLWKIAKRFGSTVDEIARVNGIENPDVLEIGKQLYIPRYCMRQSA